MAGCGSAQTSVRSASSGASPTPIRRRMFTVTVRAATSCHCLQARRPSVGRRHYAARATQAVAEQLGEVAPAHEAYTQCVLHGEVWRRPGLTLRDRSLVIAAATIARTKRRRRRIIPIRRSRMALPGLNCGGRSPISPLRRMARGDGFLPHLGGITSAELLAGLHQRPNAGQTTRFIGTRRVRDAGMRP